MIRRKELRPAHLWLVDRRGAPGRPDPEGPMSSRLLLIASAVLAGLAAGAPEAPSSEPRPGPYRVGLTRTMFGRVREDVFRLLASPFQRLLRDQAGMAGELCLVADAEALAGQLESGTAHLGVFGGFEFAWARDRFPDLCPLALAVGREPRPTAVVVVNKDGPIRSLEDLRDKPAVLPRDGKEWCRLFAERRCPRPVPGTTAAGPAEPANGTDALDQVIVGKIPATVVDGGTLKVFADLNPHRAEWLRELCTSPPFPPTVIAYRKGGLDEEAVQGLRRALTGAKQSQQYKDLVRLWRMRGFEPVPADYDEQLARCLKDFPPPDGFGRGAKAGGKD